MTKNDTSELASPDEPNSQTAMKVQQVQSREIKDMHISDDWLRLIYSEAWKQYIHEDTQGQARMSIFLTVQTALIAILAIITKPLLDMPSKQFGSRQIYLGVGLLGLFAVIIGFFSLFLGMIWRSANKAARITLNLRWIPISAIERIAALNHVNVGLKDVNLAEFENKCRDKLKSKKDYYPYEIEGLSDLKISSELTPLPNIRGWSSITWTIWLIQVLFVLITLGGLTLLGITLYSYLCS